MFEDKIYHLTPDTIKSVFEIDFKEFMYFFDEISEKAMLEQEKKYSYFSSFYMTDDGIFVCFNHRGKYPIDICGDIHTGQLGNWKGDHPICGTYQDYFITTIRNNDELSDGALGDNCTLLFVKGKQLMRSTGENHEEIMKSTHGEK